VKSFGPTFAWGKANHKGLGGEGRVTLVLGGGNQKKEAKRAGNLYALWPRLHEYKRRALHPDAAEGEGTNE